MSESESEEENEKEDMNQKESSEVGQPVSSAIIHSLNAVSCQEFSTHDQKRHFTPYLEICSPPPETI